MKRLYWVYFGPDALRTAEHFAVHLGEFLTREGLSAAVRGTESGGVGRAAAYCDLEDDAAERVAKALRPRVVQDVPAAV